MRLDLYLKTSRLVPRRSVAQTLCEMGIVKVNGAIAKASKEVKAGDEIEIARRNRATKVRVISVPDRKQVSRSGASELYELISEVQVVDNLNPEYP